MWEHNITNRLSCGSLVPIAALAKNDDVTENIWTAEMPCKTSSEKKKRQEGDECEKITKNETWGTRWFGLKCIQITSFKKNIAQMGIWGNNQPLTGECLIISYPASMFYTCWRWSFLFMTRQLYDETHKNYWCCSLFDATKALLSVCLSLLAWVNEHKEYQATCVCVCVWLAWVCQLRKINKRPWLKEESFWVNKHFNRNHSKWAKTWMHGLFHETGKRVNC